MFDGFIIQIEFYSRKLFFHILIFRTAYPFAKLRNGAITRAGES